MCGLGYRWFASGQCFSSNAAILGYEQHKKSKTEASLSSGLQSLEDPERNPIPWPVLQFLRSAVHLTLHFEVNSGAKLLQQSEIACDKRFRAN